MTNLVDQVKTRENKRDQSQKRIKEAIEQMNVKLNNFTGNNIECKQQLLNQYDL